MANISRNHHFSTQTVYALALIGACSSNETSAPGQDSMPAHEGMVAPPTNARPSVMPAINAGTAGATNTTAGTTNAPSIQMAVDPAMNVPMMAADPGGPDGFTKDGRIVERCHGLPLKGMMFSPGGTTLPNKCAPFHIVKNNPYAIRCIDAMPDYKTPYPGDEYCILPPPADMGFQVGVHPGGNKRYWERMRAGDYSFYNDAALVGPYEMKKGDETVQNYNAAIDVPSDTRYYYRRQFRGRYGSHHGVVYFTAFPVADDAWQNNGDIDLSGTEIMMVQNSNTDYPPGSMEIPPEEIGLGSVAASTGVYFNLHHFNSSEETILRENWINIWYVPADQVTKIATLLFSQNAINYPPNQVLDNAGALTITSPTQVLNIWGHHHAWTTRFHAWVTRANGEEFLIYDSNNWADMPTFAYNSLVKNPPPGVPGMDGAFSGPLILNLGDTIHFNCHVDTTQKHADELRTPLPQAPIPYGCHAYAAEMCLLLGQQTSPSGGGFGL